MGFVEVLVVAAHLGRAWVMRCKFLIALLAAADFICSSCRLNGNHISLNSVFFLAQFLSTLEDIKNNGPQV